jgi:hypothetical protein
VDNLLSLTLAAHNPERNHHRRYTIRVGRDLFGVWTATIEYGRVGHGGRERRYSGSDADALRSVVRRCLSRRLSAPRRIGCAYRLTGYTVTAGLVIADWLPAEFIPTQTTD